MTKTASIQVRVLWDVKKRIEAAAAADGRTATCWARWVILQALDGEELPAKKPKTAPSEPVEAPVAPTRTRRTRAKDETPYEQILGLWREILPELPQPLDVSEWTDSRKAAMRARCFDTLYALEDWEKMLRYVKRSPFLTGKVPSQDGRKPFRADIDWILRPANLLKLSEGKYHNG